MLYNNRKLILICTFILSVYFAPSYAQESYRTSTNVVKTRSLAMGGAFTAIEDNIESVFYNPAACNIYKQKKDFTFIRQRVKGIDKHYTGNNSRRVFGDQSKAQEKSNDPQPPPTQLTPSHLE